MSFNQQLKSKIIKIILIIFSIYFLFPLLQSDISDDAYNSTLEKYS